MKKNFPLAVLCLLFITLCQSAFAQSTIIIKDSTSTTIITTVPEKTFKTKMVTISPGYAFVDVSGLNQFLLPGTPGFSQNFGILGLESTNECRRFIYGYTLQAGMSKKYTAINYGGTAGNNIDYNASYGNFLIHGGYSIISTERVKFYPILGAGLGGVSGNFKRIDNETITQFANNPNVEGSVTKYMACFDGALGLDFLFPHKRWDDRSYGSVLGLRVGYTQGVGMGYWRFSGARILENPSYNPGMVYAKVQFGMFKRKPKGECRGSKCD